MPKRKYHAFCEKIELEFANMRKSNNNRMLYGFDKCHIM